MTQTLGFVAKREDAGAKADAEVVPAVTTRESTEPRLIILDPSYQNSVGHYSEYDESLAAAALAAGFGVEIAGHVKARETRGEHRHVVGCYSQDIWCRLPGAQFMSDESLVWASELIRKETVAFIERIGQRAGDIVFAPNVTPPHLLAFADLLDEQAIGEVLLLLIRYQVHMFDHPLVARAWDKVRQYAARDSVRVITDSHLLARDLNAIGVLGVDVVSVPSGGQFGEGDLPARKPGPFTVTSLGPPRAEKGFCEILAAAQILALEDPSIHFVLQANNPSEDVRTQLELFKRSPTQNVTLIETAMSTKDYSTFVLSSDLVLAPYDSAIYAARTSSAVVEAMAGAKPVIASRGTWLEAFSSQHRTGLTCAFGDPEDLVRTIMAARRQIATLRNLAERSAPAIRREYTPTRLMAQLIAARDAAVAVRRPTILVLFPWTAEDVKASGSGARLHALVVEVERWGLRAEILCFGYSTYPLGEHSLVRSFRTHFWNVADEQAEVPGLDKVTDDRALHLRMHRHGAQNQQLLDEITLAANGCVGVIVEHTHLAEAAAAALDGTGMPIAVVSNDFIHDASLKDKDDHVVLAQLEALNAGTAAFSVSLDDSRRFAKLGVVCGLSKNPAQPKMLPRPGAALIADVVEAYIPDVMPGSFLLFVGSAYYPNRAAVTVLHETAAILRARMGVDAPTVVIAGSVSEPMRMDNVIALGVVPRIALEALYDSCLATVIPMFAGSGTSVKTIEAIDRGCPVLTTVSGARGLDDLAGRFQVLKCDEHSAAQAFADAIIKQMGTLAASRRPTTDSFVDSYAVDGFGAVIAAVAGDKIGTYRVPVVDLELVEELLEYAHEAYSEAAVRQAIEMTGERLVPLRLRLKALAYWAGIRRLHVAPQLLACVASEPTLAVLARQLDEAERTSDVELAPTVVARVAELGLANLRGALR